MKHKILLLLLSLVCGTSRADFALRDGDTVVFLGDSITAAGGYAKIVEQYTLLRFPERRIRFINAGQGGDTASGSLQRLERDVFNQGATVVTVAFGVNDIGWGMKADAAHEQKYLEAIRAIVEQCQARQVRPFICSAAITDEAPDRAEQGFLQKMTDKGLALAQSLGADTIDLQRGMREIQRRILASNARESDPKKQVQLHAADHVHLTDLGQMALAYALLKGLGAPADVSSVSLDAAEGKVLTAIGCAISEVKKREDGLAFTRLDQGLPLTLGIFSGFTYRGVPLADGLNRYLLTVKNLPPGEYEIRAEERLLGKVNAQRLAQGLNISTMTADAWQLGGPWDAQSCAVKELVEARDRLWRSGALRKRYLNDPQQAELDQQTQRVDAALVELQRATAKPSPYRFEIREATAAALDRAFDQLQSYHWDQSRAALHPIDEAVAAQSAAPALHPQLEARLIAVLTNSASRAAKDYACRQLSLIGTEKSVAALSKLLPDRDLTHLARYALERIPAEAAALALRQAVVQTRGPTQIGIINSLAACGDEGAAGILIELLANADQEVIGAAVNALGKIGTLKTAAALERFQGTSPDSLRRQVGMARLAAAQGLARRGQRSEAAKVFRQLYTQETFDPLRVGGLRGLIMAEPTQATELLMAALTEGDGPLRKLAVRLLVERPADYPLAPFLEKLPTLPASEQVALLEAVRLRGEPSARAAVRNACDSRETEVRLAALRAMAAVGNAEDVIFLAKVAVGEAPECAAGRLALASMPGPEPDRTILEQLPGAQPSVRIELIRALAARGIRAGAALLPDQLSQSNDAVRQAALEALAVLGDERQVTAVIDFMKSTAEPTMQKTAITALEALVGRAESRSVTPLLTGLTGANAPVRMILLEQLGRVGGREALAAVCAALSDEEPTVREAAVRILANWPDAHALPELLKIMQNDRQPGQRTVAFQGYVRLCREASRLSADQRLEGLVQAMQLAPRDEDKILVISALAEVSNLEALRVLASCLEQAALKEAAGVAAAKVAASLGPEAREEVIPILRRAAKVCSHVETQRRINELLTKLNAIPE